MEVKKSKKAKKKLKAPPANNNRLRDLERRVEVLEAIARKENPTNLPPQDPPAQVRNEVPA